MPGDIYDSVLGTAYSAYMERPWLSRLVGRLVWGGDTGPYYASMSAVTGLADGATVVDCPCGAGPALRALPSDGSVRYIGLDLSPSMLRRARGRAEARGLATVEFAKGDAADTSLPAASADLFLSYWGLHCFQEPRRAIVEAARVLVPGGRLVGCTFVRGDNRLRPRLLIRSGRGAFGSVPRAEEVEEWLADAGLAATSTRSGPMLFFDGSRSA